MSSQQLVSLQECPERRYQHKYELEEIPKCLKDIVWRISQKIQYSQGNKWKTEANKNAKQ